MPIEALIDALGSIRAMPRRQAAATLSDLLERRDRAGIPGVVVRGLPRATCSSGVCVVIIPTSGAA